MKKKWIILGGIAVALVGGGAYLYHTYGSVASMRAETFVHVLKSVQDVKYTRETVGSDTVFNDVTFTTYSGVDKLNGRIERVRFADEKVYIAKASITDPKPDAEVVIGLNEATLNAFERKGSLPVTLDVGLKGITLSGKGIDAAVAQLSTFQTVIGGGAPDIFSIVKTLMASFAGLALDVKYTHNTGEETALYKDSLDLPGLLAFSNTIDLAQMSERDARELYDLLHEAWQSGELTEAEKEAYRQKLEKALDREYVHAYVLTLKDQGILDQAIAIFAATQKIDDKSAREQLLGIFKEFNTGDAPESEQQLVAALEQILNKQKSTLRISMVRKRDQIPTATSPKIEGEEAIRKAYTITYTAE